MSGLAVRRDLAPLAIVGLPDNNTMGSVGGSARDRGDQGDVIVDIRATYVWRSTTTSGYCGRSSWTRESSEKFCGTDGSGADGTVT